jgi:16S rRNA (guanine(966)-N(2))-methyltransferase RsmD
MMSGMGKRNHHQVRVIAGQYKGRRLAYPNERILRPTMDKTREALFSAIQDRIPGCVFVDLFSAAGGVGIEALSRGASMVHFVEQLPEALALLRRNLDACGVDGNRYKIHDENVYNFLERSGFKALPETIVFADPPYDSDDALRLLSHFNETEYKNMLLFILEHRYPVESFDLGSLRFSKTKRYGETNLSFWSKLE